MHVPLVAALRAQHLGRLDGLLIMVIAAAGAYAGPTAIGGVMKPLTFDSRSSARAYLESRFSVVMGLDDARALLSEDELLDLLIEPSHPQSVGRLGIGNEAPAKGLTPQPLDQFGIRYALRDSDVDALADIVTGGISGVGVWLAGQPQLAGSAASLVAVLVWARRVARMAIKLDEAQALVLRELRRCGPDRGLTVDELKDRLEWRHIHDGDARPADLASTSALEAVLRSLGSIRRNDGISVPLVQATTDGKWSVMGI